MIFGLFGVSEVGETDRTRLFVLLALGVAMTGEMISGVAATLVSRVGSRPLAAISRDVWLVVRALPGPLSVDKVIEEVLMPLPSLRGLLVALAVLAVVALAVLVALLGAAARRLGVLLGALTALIALILPFLVALSFALALLAV